MAYRDLREFIAKLEKEGELRRIAAEIDPVLEITEITDRVTRAGGPALLFEKPKGSRVPLLINMLGSERRMNLALKVSHVDEVGARIRGFLDMQSPQGLLDKLSALGLSGKEPSEVLVSGAEFILEGLYAHKRIGRSEERTFTAGEKPQQQREKPRRIEEDDEVPDLRRHRRPFN